MNPHAENGNRPRLNPGFDAFPSCSRHCCPFSGDVKRKLRLGRTFYRTLATKRRINNPVRSGARVPAVVDLMRQHHKVAIRVLARRLLSGLFDVHLFGAKPLGVRFLAAVLALSWTVVIVVILDLATAPIGNLRTGITAHEWTLQGDAIARLDIAPFANRMRCRV